MVKARTKTKTRVAIVLTVGGIILAAAFAGAFALERQPVEQGSRSLVDRQTRFQLRDFPWVFGSDNFDVLIFSMSNLDKGSDFDLALDNFIQVLDDTENLEAEYWELDSGDFESEFGVRVSDSQDYDEIQEVLEQVKNDRGVEYFIILGGLDVIPFAVRFDVPDHQGVLSTTVRGDTWYIDFDDDLIPDEDLAIGRIPDYGTQSSAIISYLETATDLHQQGGFTLEDPAFITLCNGEDDCYESPPYCAFPNDFCSCNETDFYQLLSSSDFILFTGHGSRISLVTTDHGCYIWQTSKIDEVDFSTHHPFISGYGPCHFGDLFYEADPGTLAESHAVEFLNAGASIFFANVDANGSIVWLDNNFPFNAMSNGETVGKAFVESVRHAVLVDAGYGYPAAAYSIVNQLVIYGDPTLYLRSEPANYSLPDIPEDNQCLVDF